MNSLKNIGISFLYSLGLLLILTFIMTFFHFVGFFGHGLISFLKLAIPIISLFVGGFVMGKHSKVRGWLEGLKYVGCFLVVLMLFQHLGLHVGWEVKMLFYYFILIVSAVLGSMVGIGFQKEQK